MNGTHGDGYRGDGYRGALVMTFVHLDARGSPMDGGGGGGY